MVGYHEGLRPVFYQGRKFIVARSGGRRLTFTEVPLWPGAKLLAWWRVF